MIKATPLPLFRGISGWHHGPRNFRAFATVFRNSVTGNTSRVREAIFYKRLAEKVKDFLRPVPKWDLSKPTVFT